MGCAGAALTGPAGAGWAGQSPLCRSRAVASAQRGPLAGVATGLGQLAHHVHALCPLGQKRGLGLVAGRRAGPRRGLGHPAAGLDHDSGPPARGRGSKKNGPTNALGRSRGGLSTKLHLLPDALGRPVRALLTAGQVHDRAPAEELLADLRPSCLVTDRGYDARAWRAHLAARGTQAVIPAQRKPGDTAYTPARHGMATTPPAIANETHLCQAQAVPTLCHPLR